MSRARLLGPVFYYDLLRHSRKGRNLLLRCLFVLLLFGLLALTYYTYGELLQANIQARQAWSQLPPAQKMLLPPVRQLDTSAFGETFFSYYFVVQYVVIVLITPAMVAGAITEEKQRQTIEYLFTSSIANHEIVLGKLFSRLLTIVMLILAGLPLLSLVQLFGGVSWELMVVGFSACLATMLSLACLSLYQSVHARRVREALGKAYLMIVLYFVGWGLLVLFRFIIGVDVKSGGLPLRAMDFVLQVYNAGNPVIALYQMREQTRITGTLGTLPFELLAKYSLFHFGVAILCLALAMMRLRTVYIKQMYQGRIVKKPPEQLKFLYQPLWGKKKTGRHPQLDGRDPLAWKERWFERHLRFSPLVQALFTVGVGILITPGLIFAVISILAYSNGHSYAAYLEEWSRYFRFLGAFLFGLAMMGIAIRAAGSIGSEKDRQTWDTLLAAPLSLKAVYQAKWRASLMTPRWFYVTWLFMMMLAGITICIHPLSIPTAILQAIFFACFAASLGVWFAVRSSTGLRAIIGTILTLLVLTFAAVFLQVLTNDKFGIPTYRTSYDHPQQIYGFINAAPLIGVGFTLQSGFQVENIWSDHAFNEVDGHVALILCSGLIYGSLALLLYWQGYRTLARTCGRVDGSQTSTQFSEFAARKSSSQ